MDVLSLLRSKNRCLEKFLETTTEFVAQWEKAGQLGDLTAFQSSRDAILRAIDLYDRKISEAVQEISSVPHPSSNFVERVRAVLEQKNRLIQKILLADEPILQKIEAEKSRIRGEIAANLKQSQLVQKFKSTWIPESGEEFDRQL